jgi:hypothetical protein
MNDIFPLTAVFAILIFVVKEIYELFRRKYVNTRKFNAIKKLLADEVEKNYWVIKALNSQLNNISKAEDNEEYEIVSTVTKGFRLEYTNRETGLGGGSKIWEVSTGTFDRLIIDIAELDKKLFKLASEAYEGVSTIKHVSESLIENINDKFEDSNSGLIKTFCDYGIDELADAYIKLSNLYKFCTGKNLKDFKLRSYF